MTKELKAWERMQKAIFDSANETINEPAFVPYGRCRKHPHISTSNGMFDNPCNLCEAENEGF